LKKKKNKKIINWLKKEPIFSRAEQLEVEWQEQGSEFIDFEIRYNQKTSSAIFTRN